MIFILTLTFFALGVALVAAYTDFIKLRIPNILPLLIVGSFITAYIIELVADTGQFQNISSHLFAGGCVFIVMVILFFMKLFGGGDAKLIPAVALWVGLQGLPTFLMITTFVGGGLALLSLFFRKTKIGQHALTKLIHHPRLARGWLEAMAKGEVVIPYGVAIAVGSFVAFYDIGLLP